jgi:hypothetical protein
MGKFSKHTGSDDQCIVIAEWRNSVRKLMSSIHQAPMESFGISTCVLEDWLLTVLVTKHLTLSSLVGSKSFCIDNRPLLLEVNVL